MQPVLQITLTMDASGQIKFGASGPYSNNRVAMVGLLEMGKSVILNPPEPDEEAPQPSRLVLPTGPLPPNGRH